MQEMVEGYKQTRRMLRALRTLTMRDVKNVRNRRADREYIGEMISDCDFAIEWLQSGRRPGNRRGVERLAAYQREKPVDPLRIQAFVSNGKAGSPSSLTDWQRLQIEEVLSHLSKRERECYELARGMCFSYQEIANMLGIQKSSVQSYVKTAEQKICDAKLNSLFLFQE